MRLHADDTSRRGERWGVFDVPRCQRLMHVLWVDDAIPAYCQFVQPMRVVAGEIPTRTTVVRKIEIVAAKYLVLIDPVEGSDDSIADALSTDCTVPPPRASEERTTLIEGVGLFLRGAA